MGTSPFGFGDCGNQWSALAPGFTQKEKGPKGYVPMGSQNQRPMVYFEDGETCLPQALGQATMHAKPESSTAVLLLHA